MNHTPHPPPATYAHYGDNGVLIIHVKLSSSLRKCLGREITKGAALSRETTCHFKSFLCG